MTDGEIKLRELVLLRAGRTNMLSIESEEELLELAVAQLNLPLRHAEGIIISSAEGARFEVQSEIDRVTLAMIAALAGNSRTISPADFETVAEYYSSKLRIPPSLSRMQVKELVNRLGVRPRQSGFLWSARWFRTIR